jgi:hypothetical protein
VNFAAESNARSDNANEGRQRSPAPWTPRVADSRLAGTVEILAPSENRLVKRKKAAEGTRTLDLLHGKQTL